MRAAATSSDSRLASFCDALIEACWLGAVCVVPLILIPQNSHAGYQPIKFAVIRIVAVIGVAAWLVREIERRKLIVDLARIWSAVRKSSVGVSLIIFASAVAISNVLSVNPTASLWGAFETFGGTFTTAAELALFTLVARNLRSRDQLERLVTTLLVTSLAVSAFTILQRLGWDPRFPKLPEDRAFGPIGHPIYLAGYLLMSIPLTTYRLLDLGRKGDRASRQSRPQAQIFYRAILVAQLAAFFFAESRGPTLALVVTVIAFATLRAIARGRQRLLVIGAATLLSIFVAIIVSASVVGFKNIPGLRRFGALEPMQRGVEVFRADIWNRAPQIVFATTPVTHPLDRHVDRFRALRPWIGYGAETLDSVLPFYYQIDVGKEFTIENRFHDLVWDLWFSVGAVGLAAFIGAVLFLFSAAYRALGFVRARGDIAVFWICQLVSIAIAIAIFVRLLGAGFAGVGLLGGLVAGVLLFPVVTSLRRGIDSRFVDRDLIVALLAAIAGHLIDAGFAFVTAATALLFWIYAGLLVAIIRGLQDRQSHARERASSAVLVSMGLCALSIATIHQFSFQPFSIVDLIVRSLGDIEGTNAQYSFLAAVVALFWIGGSFAFALDQGPSGIRPRFLRIVLVSGAVGLAFLLVHSAQLAHIGPIPQRTVEETAALASSLKYERTFVFATVVLMSMLFVLAWIKQTAPGYSLGSRAGAMSAAFVFAAALVAVWVVAIAPLRASVCAGWGEALERTDRRELSIPSYRRAAELDAHPFLYRALFSEASLQAGVAESDAEKRERYFADAETTLLGAQKNNDLNRSSFYLARLYLIWAETEAGPMKSNLNRRALTAARQARIFEPHTAPVAEVNDLAEKAVNSNANP